MALRDTERAVKIFKEVVSGRIAKNIGSDFGIPYTIVFVFMTLFVVLFVYGMSLLLDT
jgi:tetrahydromethanopterin S-methyltransferase subunit G